MLPEQSFYKKEVTFHFLLHADCRVSFFPLLWGEDSNPTVFRWSDPESPDLWLVEWSSDGLWLVDDDLGGRPLTSEPVSEPEPSQSWPWSRGFHMGEPKRNQLVSNRKIKLRAGPFKYGKAKITILWRRMWLQENNDEK